ncbi:hypothetical protein KDH83_31750 [Achromobacter sp. Marseille-Q0513]|nr:hypothetical protein [Achromobacter sp. Marseille-Q0513]MBR8657892.1 hypothetical protein [Achromobacter sp. Marseille-Q0513]
MPFRPALTTEDLRNMRVRNTHPDGTIDPDLLAALWEIKRLRTYPLRLHQMAGELKRPIGVTGIVYDGVLAELPAEPCVQERDQMTAELLEAPYKLRKGMPAR